MMNATDGRQEIWLDALRVYLGVIAVGDLLWETAQLPLYTIWTEGTRREKVIAVAHCTGGDLLIALAVLMLSLVISGRPEWPRVVFFRVTVLTIALGLVYTVFSEWLNIVVRRSWAYSDLMPTIPWLGTGVSPTLQWLLVPMAAFWLVRRRFLANPPLQI